MPMSATTTSPAYAAPGKSTRPRFGAVNVTVQSARTASPGTAPVSASMPVGTSTAMTIRRLCVGGARPRSPEARAAPRCARCRAWRRSPTTAAPSRSSADESASAAHASARPRRSHRAQPRRRCRRACAGSRVESTRTERPRRVQVVRSHPAIAAVVAGTGEHHDLALGHTRADLRGDGRTRAAHQHGELTPCSATARSSTARACSAVSARITARSSSTN